MKQLSLLLFTISFVLTTQAVEIEQVFSLKNEAATLAEKYKKADIKQQLKLFTINQNYQKEDDQRLFRIKYSLPQDIKELMTINEIWTCIKNTDKKVFELSIKAEQIEQTLNKDSEALLTLHKTIILRKNRVRKTMSEEKWNKKCCEWRYQGRKEFAGILLALLNEK